MKDFFEKFILPLIAWSLISLIGLWKEFLDSIEPIFLQSGQQFTLTLLRIILPSPLLWAIEVAIIIGIVALVYFLQRRK